MNGLQQFLSDIGMPWQESRAHLADNFGLRRCPWSLDEVVELDIRPPPFAGLVRPLQFRQEPFRAQHVPPTFLSGYADPCGPHAVRNLHAVADTVAAALGPGEYNDDNIEVHSFAWQCGPARLQLNAFPGRAQERRGSDEWHEREPRLAEACSITLETGYRPPLSALEREWVDRFTPALALHSGLVRVQAPASPRQPGWLDWLLFRARPRPASIMAQPAWANRVQAHVGSNSAGEEGLEYVREPPPAVERVYGKLGSAAGRQALIWCDDQLRVVPRAHVHAVRLVRYEPERNIGDQALLALRCGPPGEERRVDVPIVWRDGMDALDELGAQVADWLSMPLESSTVW